MRHALVLAFLLSACIAEVGDDEPELDTTTAELVACPTPPSSVYAQALAYWNLRLTWSDNSNNETGFRIERSDNGGAWFVAYEVGANRESTSDGFYSSNSSFRYRIRAFNNECESTPSAVATVPRSPTGLAGQYLGGGAFRLTWSDRSNNETYFMVQQKVGSGGWFDATATSRDVTTATLDLYHGTNRFRTRAASNTGSSWYTNEVSYTY